MLYGIPTKTIRHVDETDITLGPQRAYIHTFWKTNSTTATTRTDGLDLQDEKVLKLGSKVVSHNVAMRITPYTIEPQQLYMGLVKLSFHDVLARPVCGGVFEQVSYQDTATENFDVDTNAIALQLFPSHNSSDEQVVNGADTEFEIGGSSSGFNITEWFLDDLIGHFVRLAKVTLFDQRPLVSDRKQRIPKKVKRANSGTFYGIFFYNDSPRGATPSDTQLDINIKERWIEKAI